MKTNETPTACQLDFAEKMLSPRRAMRDDINVCKTKPNTRTVSGHFQTTVQRQ